MAPYLLLRQLKLMRSPCVPSDQSMASEHGSKSASSVSEQESAGSSEDGMGEKRVSSNAEVSAYVCKPLSSGSPSNVPMQPRRDLWPDLDMVFHVTNNGNDSVTDSLDAYDGLAVLLDIDV